MRLSDLKVKTIDIKLENNLANKDLSYLFKNETIRCSTSSVTLRIKYDILS